MEDNISLLAGVFTLIFLFFTIKYTYWRRRKVPGPSPIPIFGNYMDYYTYRRCFGETVQSIYENFPNEPYVGAYFGTEPVLIPKDPEMIKTILAKDFHIFSGRMLVGHEHREPLVSSHLFSAAGDNWKALRLSFNPMFTTAKLKAMYSMVHDSGKKLDSFLDQRYNKSNIQNVKEIAMNFTLEVIGATVFGMDFNTINDENNEIRHFACKILEHGTKKFIKTNIRETWPSIFYNFIGKKAPQFEGGVDSFLIRLSQKSFDIRGNTPTGRNDLIDYLLKFKEKGFLQAEGLRNSNGESKTVKMETTEPWLTSQIFLFFAAGFETTTMTLSLAMYELAKHPDIQKRVLEEINEVLEKNNGELTFESIKDLKYMEMVISETMRKYPVLGTITREVMSDYKFEDYDLKVEKGLRVHLPVWAIHYDPKYYPEPEKFDPERFTPEEVQKRPAYTFLAFGEGQRRCIALRYTKMPIAVALTTILRKFTLEKCSTTAEKLDFEPRSFAIAPKNILNLKFVPRK